MSKKFDWKGTLASVAPGLAGMLGGPMAGMAAKIAVDALGYGDQGEASNIDALETAVASADPNVFLKLREAENQLKLELKKLDLSIEELSVNREKVAAGDRNSARDMAKSTGVQPQLILGVIYTGGFVWILTLLFTGGISLDPEHEQLANVLIGMLATGQTQVLNFFLGSSTGSKDKDRAMAITAQASAVSARRVIDS